MRAPILLMHARWMRSERYGLVGALDADDVHRVQALAPQTQVVRSRANHVVHRYVRRLFVHEIHEFAHLHDHRLRGVQPTRRRRT